MSETIGEKIARMGDYWKDRKTLLCGYEKKAGICGQRIFAAHIDITLLASRIDEALAAAHRAGRIEQARRDAEACAERGWANKDRNPTDYEQGARDMADKLANRIRAALAAAERVAEPSAPSGWKLVPVEPTEAMRQAAFGPVLYGGPGSPITKDFLNQERGLYTYRAMLAAAPLPPPPEKEGRK